MAADTDKILVIEFYPLDADGVEQAAEFLASHAWATASTDTPASKPAIALIDGPSFSWQGKCYRFDDGFFRPGGVMRYSTATVRVENPLDADGTAPLDTLAGLYFDGARAIVYLSDADTSGAEPTLDITLANLDRWFPAQIISFDIEPDATDTSVLTLGPPTDLEQECVWWYFRGLGSAALSPITRPDHSALRDSTSSFTWIVAARWQNAAAGTWLDSPLFRVVDNAGANAIRCQIRNAAGSWQGFGTGFTANVAGYYIIVVTYNVTNDMAVFYVDGVQVASMTITGGLYASAASAATNWQSISTNTWEVAGSQHIAAVLDADEIASVSFRGIEDHSSATMTLAFNETTGSQAIDGAGNQDATVTSAVWVSTGEGIPSLAGTRPPAVVGAAFGVPLFMVNVANGLGAIGYAGERVGIAHAVQAGLRMEIAQTLASLSTTLNSTFQTIYPVPRLYGIQYAQGQTITMTTASAVGNPASYTITKILGNPALNQTFTIVTTGIVANETITTTFTTASTDVTPATSGIVILRDGSSVAYPGCVLGVTPSDDIQLSMQIESGDTAMSALEHVLKKFGGRASAPAITRELANSYIYHHGYVTPGETTWGDLLDHIALSSLSTEYGPMGVYFESDGDLAARGMLLNVGTDDFVIQPTFCSSIVELRESRQKRPGKIIIQYQQNNRVLTSLASGSDDALEAELHEPGREVSAGTGKAAIAKSSLMLYPEAYGQVTRLARLQNFRAYRVGYRGPLTAANIRTATDGPFLQTSVSWAERAPWVAARQGFVVGWQATPLAREGDEELALVFATEE